MRRRLGTRWLARGVWTAVLIVGACGRIGFDAPIQNDLDDAGDAAQLDAGLAGLIHRYSFDGSGTDITDSVGHADGRGVNCRVSQGSISLMQGVSGDYIEFPPGLISGLSAVTFEVWLKWDGGDPRQRIFDFGNNNASGAGTSFFMLEPESGAGKLAAYVNFTSAASDPARDLAAIDSNALSTVGVQHVAVTFDGRRLGLYLNGAPRIFTDSAPQSLSSIDDRNNWLGRSQFSRDPELDAIIHEFRIYDRALTASEIAASFEQGANL